MISSPKSYIKCADFSFYSLDKGSECGNTVVGYNPFMLTEGRPVLGPALPPISGKLLTFPGAPESFYLLLLWTSILTDLFLVATLSSSSVISM